MLKRYLIAISLLACVGIVAVYGEVEAYKVGDDIRYLNLEKREMTLKIKAAEYKLASLSTLDRLESRLQGLDIVLGNTKFIRIARVDTTPQQIRLASNPTKNFLSNFLVRTAQADNSK
ncbi:MAG: hypothetical protein ACI9CF_000817 [Candidatus Omnitrophota bacterium]|jgi:hypothetical protein